MVLLLLVSVTVLLSIHLFEHYKASSEMQLAKINTSSLEFKKLIRPTFFNIEDFGGRLDKEDNSEALQAAIDAAIVISEELRSDDKWDLYVGKVYIPSGVWKFEKGIKSTYGVEIFGDGVSKTYLDFNGENTFLDFSSENEKFDLKIRDLFIRQHRSTATAISLNQVNRNSGVDNIIIEGGGIGINIKNCYTTRFSSFFIYNTKNYGVLAHNATNTDFVDFKIENCTVGAMFTNSETNSSAGLKLFGGVIQGSRNEGLILKDLTNFSSYSTFFEGNARIYDKPQILITSDLNGEYDNDIIAFYSPFVTGGYTSAKNSTSVFVENTTNFIFNEGFIRSNDKIEVGIKIGESVANAQVINSNFSGVQTDILTLKETTNLIVDYNLRGGRGYGRHFLGLGAESTKANNRHYSESFQGVFGKSELQRVGVGTFDGKPSIQGFGAGTSFNLYTNPKAGDHISAPNGITQVSGLKLGTIITSSNAETDKQTHTVLINTDEGNRTLKINKTEEEVRRSLVVKNTGTNGNVLEIKSASSRIEKNNRLILEDGWSVSLVHDGSRWNIVSMYKPASAL